MIRVLYIGSDKPNLSRFIKEGIEIFTVNSELDIGDDLAKDYGIILANNPSIVKELVVKYNKPVILRASDEHIEEAFYDGAYDFVSENADPTELTARIRNCINKIEENGEDDSGIIEKDGFYLNTKARTLKIDGKHIKIDGIDLGILMYLAKNNNIAKSRQQIVDALESNYNIYTFATAISTHIKTIRKALGKYYYLIQTIRGYGYRFDLDAEADYE